MQSAFHKIHLWSLHLPFSLSVFIAQKLCSKNPLSQLKILQQKTTSKQGVRELQLNSRRWQIRATWHSNSSAEKYRHSCMFRQTTQSAAKTISMLMLTLLWYPMPRTAINPYSTRNRRDGYCFYETTRSYDAANVLIYWQILFWQNSECRAQLQVNLTKSIIFRPERLQHKLVLHGLYSLSKKLQVTCRISTYYIFNNNFWNLHWVIFSSKKYLLQEAFH